MRPPQGRSAPPYKGAPASEQKIPRKMRLVRSRLAVRGAALVAVQEARLWAANSFKVDKFFDVVKFSSVSRDIRGIQADREDIGYSKLRVLAGVYSLA